MKGKFLTVKCKCGEEVMVFSHSTSKIVCPKCNEKLVHPTGGKAVILAEESEEKE